jgi:DNA uptake protein ComE-like DNA-binding protein
MNKAFKNYLTFSKKDRIAVIVLLLIIFVFLLLPYFFSVKKNNLLVDKKLVDTLVALQQQKPKEKSYSKANMDKEDWPQSAPQTNNTAIFKGELFEFDPNTLGLEGWQKLGIREKTAKTILNYTSKGGKFKTPEDLRKIWGFKKEEVDRIIPYAKIVSNSIQKSNVSLVSASNNTKPILFDANTATPQELKTIPNIGNSLPYKIINYREKLGGFLNMAQLKETYGMTDSLFHSILPYLHVLPTTIRKLNINAATEYELNAHPYIDKTLAKAITIYRTQHGGFKTIDDLKKIVFVKQELFDKISPYLTIE